MPIENNLILLRHLGRVIRFTQDNHIGSIVHDEEVFVSSIVPHYGAILGLVVATTHEQAVYAAKQVAVTYKDLPAIISIEDAVIR